MPSFASLDILSWDFEALNPDGTPNSFLSSVTGGSVPPDPTTETIEWPAMSQRCKLSIDFELSGNLANGNAAELGRAILRYAPALFLEYMGIYTPPGTFPVAAYGINLPASPVGTYVVPLVGQGEWANCAINGDVTLTVVSATEFTIEHEFYMTASVENYPVGQFSPNYYRYSKNSIYAAEEGTITRPSVYGELKGLNILCVVKQGTQNIISTNLSIPIRASFNGYDNTGDDSEHSVTWQIELSSDPGTAQDYLSPFEENKVIVAITDGSNQIVQDQNELSLVRRDLTSNVGTFTEDFDLVECKLITSSGTAQVEGPIYEPVTWSQTSGVTTITFRVDGTKLLKAGSVQFHIRAGRQDDPSTTSMRHFMSEVYEVLGAPPENSFTMESEFYTRNAQHGNNMTVLPMARVTNYVQFNKSEYNTSAATTEPWTTFNADFRRAKIEIEDANGDILFTQEIENSSSVGIQATEYIGVYNYTSGSDQWTVLYLKEFRVPYLNFQELMNWIGSTLTFRWSAYFEDPTNSEFAAWYTVEGELTVSDYQNDEPSPLIDEIEFLDPATGFRIDDWSDLDSIRVRARCVGATASTCVTVYVDKYPLGVYLYNDLALEERDPSTHALPPYIIFEQKLSDLISELPDQPTDEYISFLVDITDLEGSQEWRIFVEAYES